VDWFDLSQDKKKWQVSANRNECPLSVLTGRGSVNFHALWS